MGSFNRIRPDPGFVSPVRSDPGFVSPIRSDPIRSDPGFVNGPFSASLMPALNAQSPLVNICPEFFESRPNRKVVPSTPRLSFWTVLFRHNRHAGR